MEEEKKEEQVTNTEITNANAEQIQNNELKEQQESKKTKTVKGKGLKAYIIVIIIIALAITYGCGFLLGKKLYEKENEPKGSDKQVNQPQEEPNKESNIEQKDESKEPDKPVEQSNNKGNNTEKPNIEQKGINEKNIDENAISRLLQFVIAASYDDSVGNGYASEFMNGKKTIEQKEKYAIAWNSLIMIREIPRQKTITIPDRYKDDIYFQGGNIEEIAISDYTNEYKSLFNEEPNYNEIVPVSFGCPTPYRIDVELGKIFIGRECGGTGNPEYYYKIYKYDEDNSFYYVYQYVAVENPINETIDKIKTNEAVNVSSFEGNEDKFETVVWKFDKNFNFISTENVGVVSK